MNKLFVKPEIDIYKFAFADIVCTSGLAETEDSQEIGNEDNNDHDFEW